MYFKKIETSSLAHYSYVIGEGEEMVVIDPQSDIDTYLQISREQGMKITSILETHRNEDFIAGSRALVEKTGAKVYIAADEGLNYSYGERIEDGRELRLETMKIKALHTPGHTLGHMSYVLYLKENLAYMVFSGDALFFGGVGRTDFYGKERLKEMTGHLYDSIFNKLLPLGDHVILCPAHGAGSACGKDIEDRPLSTLGYERKHNPNLSYKSKEEFIEKLGKMLYKPAYFNHMEEINLTGSEPIDCSIDLKVKTAEELKIDKNHLVDVRSQQAFLGEHIEDSLYTTYEGIASYINWFLPVDSNITFITANQEKEYLNNLYLTMRRIGYNGELSFLANGIDEWKKEYKNVKRTRYILAEELKRKKDKAYILDVREADEFEEIPPIDGSKAIPLQEIKDRYEELPEGKKIYVVCASGSRATVVSSFLEGKGFKTSVLLGGMKAWKNLD